MNPLARFGLWLARRNGYRAAPPLRLDTWAFVPAQEVDPRETAKEMLRALGPFVQLPQGSAARQRLEYDFFVSRSTTQDATDEKTGQVDPLRLAYHTGIRDAHALLLINYTEAVQLLEGPEVIQAKTT